MNKHSDDELIVEMIAQAALASDATKAAYLHACWTLEFTPKGKAELKMLYGDDYERLLKLEALIFQ